MNKLTMAHEYFLRIVSNPSVTLRAEDLQNIQHNAWVYADAMQAEADKRNNKETCDKNMGLDSSVLKPSNSMELEWQPDWSQAPDWANWWAIDKDLVSFWHEDKPKFDEIEFYQCGMFCDAPRFNYQGNWKDSLRKHP